MKTTNKILMAAVAVAMCSLSQTGLAGEILRSPRDASNQPRVASGSATSDLDLLRPYTGRYVFSPKALGNRLIMAIGTTPNDPDLVRRDRAILYTGKNPRRDLQSPAFEIGPIK